MGGGEEEVDMRELLASRGVTSIERLEAWLIWEVGGVANMRYGSLEVWLIWEAGGTRCD